MYGNLFQEKLRILLDTTQQREYQKCIAYLEILGENLGCISLGLLTLNSEGKRACWMYYMSISHVKALTNYLIAECRIFRMTPLATMVSIKLNLN
jgi:hypothetical protein